MSEDTTPEHCGILVVGNGYRRPWGTGKTVQQARKNGYGIRKADHQTIYYFRHNNWAVNGYGSPVYPPDVEPPVAVTMYKGEIIKMTPAMTIMFEVDGVPSDVAHQALELASAKLPVSTRIVSRPGEQ